MHDTFLVRNKENKNKKREEEVLSKAKARFNIAIEAESDLRQIALEDLKFRAGEQWPDEIKNQRAIEGRPCLTVNKLPGHVRQVTNDQRQNRPSIRVSPVDDKADVETAKTLQGLIRHIEYNSNADVAFDTAFSHAVESGFGYFRVITEYENPTSFNQEIKIKRIKNRFAAYLDPYHQEPDGSDANWAFVVETYEKEEYKEIYPNSELASLDSWDALGASNPEWMSEDACKVVEYFYKEYEEKELALLNTGETIDASLAEELPEGIEIVNKRKTKVPKIKWCKLNGCEVLEETDWPGIWIPIIPVIGDEVDVDGKKILEGIIRHAKDPQRMYNFWATSETELIALAPKAPFIAAEGQIEGYESEWQSANRVTHSVLQYKPTTVDGQIVAPPQRNNFEPPVMAITQARLQSVEDLKSTTGIYDASLGSRSNEKSGVAIMRRNIQAQTGNFHFVDNLSRAIRHLGRILIDLIPKIYDTERAVRIIGEDGQEQVVNLYSALQPDGKEKVIDFSIGKYDVAVDTGPSFASKRQEAAESIMGFIQAYPNAGPLIGDLLAKNMDWPGAQEISERLRKTVPPEVLGDDEKNPQAPLPPQVQQQMQQMQMMLEQLTGQLNQAQEKLNNKQLELDSKERIEMLKAETELRIALLKTEAEIGSRESQLAFEKEIAQLDRAQQISMQQNLNGAGPNPSVMPNEINQQPTDGFSSGNYMGENP